MGNCKTISIEELKKGNPRMCLLALRAFGRCFECGNYEKCDSKIVSKKGQEYLQRKAELEEGIKKTQEELEKLKTDLNKEIEQSGDLSD
jgi:predicted ATP-dependent serine protease